MYCIGSLRTHGEIEFGTCANVTHLFAEKTHTQTLKHDVNVNNHNNRNEEVAWKSGSKSNANDHDDDCTMRWRNSKCSHRTNEWREEKKNWRISRTREKWNWIFSHKYICICTHRRECMRNRWVAFCQTIFFAVSIFLTSSPRVCIYL